MSYEDRMDAMSDHNAEQQAEGFSEGFYQGVEAIKEKLRAALVNKPFSNFKADIMYIIEEEVEETE